MMTATDAPSAPADLERLIDTADKTLCKSGCVLIVSSLPPNSNADWNSRINMFNSKIKSIVEGRNKAGEHILFSDGNTGFDPHKFSDGIHPDDQTSAVIGQRIAAQIEIAAHKPWLAPIGKRGLEFTG